MAIIVLPFALMLLIVLSGCQPGRDDSGTALDPRPTDNTRSTSVKSTDSTSNLSTSSHQSAPAGRVEAGQIQPPGLAKKHTLPGEHAPDHANNNSAVGLAEAPGLSHAGGTTVNLEGRFRHVAAVTVGSDGTVSMDCKIPPGLVNSSAPHQH